MVWIFVQITWMLTFICLVCSNFLCSKKCITDICFQKCCLLPIYNSYYCRTYCKTKCCVPAFTPHLLIKPKYIRMNDLKTYPVRMRWWWSANLFVIVLESSNEIKSLKNKSKERKMFIFWILYFLKFVWDTLFRDLIHLFLV